MKLLSCSVVPIALLLGVFCLGATENGPAKAPNLPPSEMLALNDLYVSTNGDDWQCGNDDQYDWNFSPTANPCTDNWTGISCILPYPYDTYYLSELRLDYCHMYGTLPDSIGNFGNLTTLWLYGNTLTGTLPNTVGNLLQLQEVEMAYNHLHGTLPASISQLLDLQTIDISYNSFSGSLPYGLLWNSKIQNVHAPNNNLHGTLPGPPEGWDSMYALLRNFDLSVNHLSGTLPGALAQVLSLYSLKLFQNRLTGTINLAIPPYVSELLLNNNQFTGELSANFFTDKYFVQQLTLQENCFHGTVPPEVCYLSRAQMINMACLSCSSACVTSLYPNSAFITHNKVSGSIPTCLFEMSTLFTLHLEDNQLSGSIPYHQSFALLLERVYLYNNMLTGQIPARLGLLPYNYFFLYNNKFSGTLDLNITTNQPYWAFDATYNRLSGRINTDILTLAGKEYSNVEMLTGNLFSCNSDRSDLPSSDSDVDKYQCGSDSYNKPYIVWTAAVFFLLCVATLLYVYRDKVSEPLGLTNVFELLLRWRGMALGDSALLEITAVPHIWEVTRVLCKVGIYCALLATLVLAPIYTILTAYYGTYKYQYAWTVSSLMIAGRLPFALQFLLFLATLSILIFVFKTSSVGDNDKPARTETGWRREAYVAFVCTVYVLINFGVVGAANIGFVTTSMYAPPVYQLYISAFKVFWNVLCSPYLSRWLVYQLSASRVDFFSLELLVSLMNNVGLPLLAVFTISPQCFYNLYCSAVKSYGTETCNYPFHYYYQCSYVYMNYYGAAFIYVSIFTTFGTPFIEVVAQQLHKRAPSNTIWYKIIDIPLPRIFKPMVSDVDLVPPRSAFRPYFDSTQYMINQLTFLGLILTLGVVSPPLAVTLSVSMLVTAAFTVLKVGRFLSNAVDVQQVKYVELIEDESRGVATPDMLKTSTWMLLYFSCCFMTLFLFDTLGDAVGFQKSYWVLIVVPLLPLVAYTIMRTVRAVRKCNQQSQEVEIPEGKSEVEYALLDHGEDSSF